MRAFPKVVPLCTHILYPSPNLLPDSELQTADSSCENTIDAQNQVHQPYKLN